MWKVSTLKYYLTLVLGDNFLVIYLHLAQSGHKGTTSVLRNQLYSKAKFEVFFPSFPIEKWTLKSNFSPWKIIGLFGLSFSF